MSDLSEEMKANGWVSVKDEETGCTFVYNKKFTDEFWKADITNVPLVSFTPFIMNLNKDTDEATL